MLIMQFLWKYIDDVMGKGIDYFTIFKLLFFASMSLIPLALPLAMLLSSIMTLGNLAENNELTALKSAGLSLYKILKPLTAVVIVICISTFYFANYLIPVANLKWRSIIYDIQETKIAALLTPGVYSKQLDGLSIKIREGSQSKFKDIVIHDHTSNNVLKTIKAKEGELLKSTNGSHIILFLKDGTISEELQYKKNANDIKSENQSTTNFLPNRRSSFATASYKIEVSGFQMNKTNEDLFENSHEMMNVFQISKTLDSIDRNILQVQANFQKNITHDLAYFQALDFQKDSLRTNRNPVNQSNYRQIDQSQLGKAIDLNQRTNKQRSEDLDYAISKIRDKKTTLEAQSNFLRVQKENIARYKIEYNRKFALSITIVVLFFVGAPLGAIIRKGGFGAPVVIAALIFMIYFVLISIGDSMASSFVVSPFIGMWFPTFILTPVAILLMRSAANDSKIFDKEAWIRFVKKFRK